MDQGRDNQLTDTSKIFILSIGSFTRRTNVFLRDRIWYIFIFDVMVDVEGKDKLIDFTLYFDF